MPRNAASTASTSSTLSRSSVEPFLQFSSRRDLREKAFKAWVARGDGGGATDNKAIIAEMVALRTERARLLGYDTFAHFRLDDAMAKTPQAVRTLLERVWEPARGRALADRDAMQAMIQAEGHNFALAPWDWRYYAEKLRKARFDVDEAAIKPYFQLDRIIEAAFHTANRLFGLTFKPLTGIPTWHDDVRVWEVTGAGGRHMGLFFGDYFARPSKHSGAWMTTIRDQEKLRADIRPLVVNVMNFNKARAGRADAAVVRRRPHAVPRIRPCAARPPVRRHLPDDLRHQRADRLGRAAVAALRALAAAAGNPAAIRRALPHRRADARGTAAQAFGGAHLQPGLRDGGICRLRAGRSRHPSAADARRTSTSGRSSRLRSRASACRPRS